MSDCSVVDEHIESEFIQVVGQLVTWPRSDRSAVRYVAVDAPSLSSSSHNASSADSRRATITSSNPRTANCRAIAAPMPRLAPVTITLVSVTPRSRTRTHPPTPTSPAQALSMLKAAPATSSSPSGPQLHIRRAAWHYEPTRVRHIFLTVTRSQLRWSASRWRNLHRTRGLSARLPPFGHSLVHRRGHTPCPEATCRSISAMRIDVGVRSEGCPDSGSNR